jgi:uncharacterized phage protein (TIGR01671 family)
MREIKFRAWDEKQKRMVYDFETVPYFASRVITIYDAPKCMQFTGLKDVDGKEIYEGDIISVDANARFPVEFTNGYFGVRVNKQPPGTFLIEGFWALADFTVEVKNVCRVIGNIHENPELLQK